MTTGIDRPSHTARVRVDATLQTPLRHIWTYVGYDEPNYTYTPNGGALLASWAVWDAPYYIRCHFCCAR